MNIYLSLIQEISHPNKYTKWYVNIVSNALDRDIVEENTENHHIVPESFFKSRFRNGPPGILDGDSSNINNFVCLTYKEHFIVHLLLPKMVIHKTLQHKTSCALIRMMNNKYYNSMSYQTAKKIYVSSLLIRLDDNRQNMLDAHGVDYYVQSEEFKEKAKQTNLENYGAEWYTQTEEFKEKSKIAILDKYGVEFYTQSDEYKEQNKQICLEKYGVENVSQLEETKQKVKNTKLERYGDENYTNLELHRKTIKEVYNVDNVFQIEDVKEKAKQTKLEKYGNAYYNNREKASETRKRNNKQLPLQTCPHCGKEGRGNSMKMWHFDNCKFKT
jgi:hypothetical protein